MRKKEPVCVSHTCKHCGKAFVALDLTNAQSRPPTWKYCDDCCKKFGYVNPEIPPKKIRSEKQMETIEKNQFQKRKK